MNKYEILGVYGMITTICMNPSFDKTVEVDALTLGEVNRIRASRTDMGGKGINVAVVLRRLGMDCRCVGVMGENGSDTLHGMLDAEGIAGDFMTVPGSVRVNTKIVCRERRQVTELNEPGAPMDEGQLQAFIDLVREKAAGSGYVVLTGSIPPGCPEGTYCRLMQAMEGTDCILDAGGRELELGAEARPFLIKPNLGELQASLGLELRTLRAIRDAALIYLRKGVKHVVVSMGSMGAMYVGQDKTLFAPALRVDARSTVGAGDAMVGGLLRGLKAEGDMARAFRYGVAAGAASVMTEGTQLIVPEDFNTLLGQVKVQEV